MNHTYTTEGEEPVKDSDNVEEHGMYDHHYLENNKDVETQEPVTESLNVETQPPVSHINYWRGPSTLRTSMIGSPALKTSNHFDLQMWLGTQLKKRVIPMTSMTLTTTSTRIVPPATVPEVVRPFVDARRTDEETMPVRTITGARPKTRETTVDGAGISFPFGNMGLGMVTATNTNPSNLVTAIQTTPAIASTARSTICAIKQGDYSYALNRTIEALSREEENFARNKTNKPVQLKDLSPVLRKIGIIMEFGNIMPVEEFLKRRKWFAQYAKLNHNDAFLTVGQYMESQGHNELDFYNFLKLN